MGNQLNEYNAFIKSSISELKLNRLCYVYTEDQVKHIKEIVENKLKKKLAIKKNECGYTLNIVREKNIEKN